MEEDIKLHITSLQFEGIIQASWDTQLETFELVVDISEFRAKKLHTLILGSSYITHYVSAYTIQDISSQVVEAQ
jgi:hypothetical protein